MNRVTIITVNRNNAHGLRKTIASVIAQTYGRAEFIVIDGASTDNSIEEIKKHQHKISYWISEPDRGIYHAMNKGIEQAKGAYCIFMNSGDVFYDDEVLEKIAGSLGDSDILYGDCFSYYKDTPVTIRPARTITAEYFLYQTLNHQSCLIKTSLLRELGGYDESTGMLADQEFFLKAAKARASFGYVQQKISFFDPTGISSDHNAFIENRRTMLTKYFNVEEITFAENRKQSKRSRLIFYSSYIFAIVGMRLSAKSRMRALKLLD